jgi:hypothetical protein
MCDVPLSWLSLTLGLIADETLLGRNLKSFFLISRTIPVSDYNPFRTYMRRENDTNLDGCATNEP